MRERQLQIMGIDEPLIRQRVLAALETDRLPDGCGGFPIAREDRDMDLLIAAANEHHMLGSFSAESVIDVVGRLVASGVIDERRHYFGDEQPGGKDYRGFKRIYCVRAAA